MDRRGFIVQATAGLTGVLSGCLSQIGTNQRTRTERRTYRVDTETRLRVHNRNGSVTVRGYNGDSMDVDIEIHYPTTAALESVSVTDTRTTNGLTLMTEYDDTLGHQRASVSLTIRYPRNAPVERIQTSNGPIEITDTIGDLELESQNGDLSVRNVAGTIWLRTHNGQITARKIGGIAGAKTSNGSIEIDIPMISDDTEIQTSNGDIDAALASDLNAAVSASTSNSTVTLHGLKLASKQISQTSASGLLGQGTHPLTLETSNGSIDLRLLSE